MRIAVVDMASHSFKVGCLQGKIDVSNEWWWYLVGARDAGFEGKEDVV